MGSFSFCLYYSSGSYYTNRPDKVGFGQALTPGELVEQVMKAYQLPFVAYAFVSSAQDNRQVLFTSLQLHEFGLVYATRQGL